MARSYRKIVADYHRQYPHHVALTNAGDWRSDYTSRAHYAVTGGRLICWSEDDRSVFGFQTAEQAAAFQRWADGSGIDWTVAPRDQSLPLPPHEYPERPIAYGSTPEGRGPPGRHRRST